MSGMSGRKESVFNYNNRGGDTKRGGGETPSHYDITQNVHEEQHKVLQEYSKKQQEMRQKIHEHYLDIMHPSLDPKDIERIKSNYSN